MRRDEKTLGAKSEIESVNKKRKRDDSKARESGDEEGIPCPWKTTIDWSPLKHSKIFSRRAFPESCERDRFRQ